MVSCNVSCGAQLVKCFFLGMLNSPQMVIYRPLDRLKIQMSKACIDRSDSWIFQHKRRPRVTKYKKYILGSHTRLRSTESQTFYWSIMTADDNIKCRCANSGMTGQVGGFPEFVCKRFLPFFHTPSPLFYLCHFSRGL